MATAQWTDEDLERVGAAEELQLSSPRRDGSDAPATTMWVVRVDGDLYVRSAGGPRRPWYRRALAAGTGRIHAGGITRPVTLEPATDAADNHAIDDAYHAKYDRYGPRIVGSVTGDHAHRVTIRLAPAT